MEILFIWIAFKELFDFTLLYLKVFFLQTRKGRFSLLGVLGDAGADCCDALFQLHSAKLANSSDACF